MSTRDHKTPLPPSETRDQLRLKAKDQLDEITRRTILENEQISQELKFQSRETEAVLEANQLIADENKTLRRNVELHRELEEELARRTHIYQKLIKRLHAKLKAKEEEEKDLRDRRRREREDMRSDGTCSCVGTELVFEKGGLFVWGRGAEGGAVCPHSELGRDML